MVAEPSASGEYGTSAAIGPPPDLATCRGLARRHVQARLPAGVETSTHTMSGPQGSFCEGLRIGNQARDQSRPEWPSHPVCDRTRYSYFVAAKRRLTTSL